MSVVDFTVFVLTAYALSAVPWAMEVDTEWKF